MFELFIVGGCASALWASVRVMKEGGAQQDGVIALLGLWGAVVSGLYGFVSAVAVVKELL